MARTNANLTQAEAEAYHKFCDDHDIADVFNNGKIIGDYIAAVDEDITPATLAQALAQVRDQIVFLTPAQLVAKQAGCSLDQAEVVVSVLSRRTLDQRFAVEDATTVARYLLAQGWAFGPANIDLSLTNIGSRPGDTHVHWAKYEQDSERAAREAKEKNKRELEAIQAANREKDPEPPASLPGYLREHWRMMNRKSDANPAQPADNSLFWKSKAEGVHLDVRSHNKQAELNRMFVMQPSNPTEIDWEQTYKARRWECDLYRNRGGK